MRIDKIDGWRFWAVSAVIVSHLIAHSQYHSTMDAMVNIEGIGLLGVEVFFFISGFVICSTLIKEFKELGFISIRAFYTRRCFRILPPLWIYLLGISVAAAYGLIEFDVDETWVSVFFVSNLSELFRVHWFVGHTWSLSYEEQFYIVFPIVFLIAYRANRKLWFLFALAFFPVFSLLCYSLGLETAAGFFRFFDFMLWGVVFAIYKDAIAKKLLLLKPTAPILMCLLMVLISITPANKFSTSLSVFLLPPLVAITVTSTVLNESLIDDYLTNRAVCYLGRASFGIYLWQQVATARYDGAGFGFYFLAISGMVLYVVFQYEFFEKRLIMAGSRVSKRIVEREKFLKQSPDFAHFPR